MYATVTLGVLSLGLVERFLLRFGHLTDPLLRLKCRVVRVRPKWPMDLGVTVK